MLFPVDSSKTKDCLLLSDSLIALIISKAKF